MTVRVRVMLPYHLRNLAKADGEVVVEVAGGEVTARTVLDAVEQAFPALGGTIRDHVTQQRRAYLRFFVCGEDWSFESVDRALPEAVVSGREPFIVIGAISGGRRGAVN